VPTEVFPGTRCTVSSPKEFSRITEAVNGAWGAPCSGQVDAW